MTRMKEGHWPPGPWDDEPDALEWTDAATGLPAGVSAATGRVSRAAYEQAVDVCRAEIREGNAFQVCLTTAFAVGQEARDAPPALR